MSDPGDEPSKGWAGRVAFSAEGGGFAYRPDEVLVGGARGRDVARRSFPDLEAEEDLAIFPQRETGQVFRMRGAVNPLEVVHELRSEGVFAQPNHVFFAHGDGCCGPHPSLRWCGAPQASHFDASSSEVPPFFAPSDTSPSSAAPFDASPFYASPFYASPFYASPFYASPFYASALQPDGRRRSSALPAGPSASTVSTYVGEQRFPRVVVLDTGFAAESVRPAELAWLTPGREHWELPDEDRGGYLDPAGGHGTYISGLIEQLAPGCDIVPEKLLTTMGDGDEGAIAKRIEELAIAGDVDLLNLSFGGYALERPHVLEAALRRVQEAGTVVVASAGNDATCRPTYPAASTGVVGVGALGPGGPAPFTNYGHWVRACAPGVDMVAPFFAEFIGAGKAPPGIPDADDFHGWARWSGTSFATPAVVAALAREMRLFGTDARQAMARVIDAPTLCRIPDLGTVVNLG